MVDIAKLAFLRHLTDEARARQANYVVYRDYYDGEQGVKLTQRQKEFLQQRGDMKVCDNYCRLVVDALADRLIATDITSADEETNEILAKIIEHNRWDALQLMVHERAGIDGDGYIMVDWPEAAELPRISFQYAFTSGMIGGTNDGVTMHFSAEDIFRPDFGSKSWLETGADGKSVQRLNLYYVDRTEKYRAEGAEIDDWQLTDTIDWTFANGVPLGVPLFHFRNGRGSLGNYGASEMRAAIPLQDLLNKTLIDLIAQADTAAFSPLVMSGVSAPIDSDGNIEATRWFHGQVFYLSDPQARAAFMLPGDLSPVMSLAEYFSMEIARVTDTPVSRFQTTAQRASASTLQEEEKGLVSKASHRQTVFGDVWVDAFTMALKLMEAKGGQAGLVKKAGVLSCQWKDPRTADIMAQNEKVKTMLEAGMPLEYMAKRYWQLDEDDWLEVVAQKERQDVRNGDIASLVVQGLNRGQGNEGEVEG